LITAGPHADPVFSADCEIGSEPLGAVEGERICADNYELNRLPLSYRSARLDDPIAQLPRGGGHPVVVDDERTQFVAKFLCRGEVNCVQRAKLGWKQHAGGVQNSIVHANEIDPLEHGTASGHRLIACRPERT
jgi:hypothetical protein